MSYMYISMYYLYISTYVYLHVLPNDVLYVFLQVLAVSILSPNGVMFSSHLTIMPDNGGRVVRAALSLSLGVFIHRFPCQANWVNDYERKRMSCAYRNAHQAEYPG